MSDDLAARLRAYKPDHREPDIQDLDCVEAAAALEAKDARIAELEARVAAAEANVDAFLDERDAAPPQADAEALIEALRWYAEKAESMSRYMNAKPPKDNAMLAIMVELSLDAGNRARAYLAEKDAP